MFRCISKFDIEDEEELAWLDEALTNEERQAVDERREARLAQYLPDPISDDDEDESVSNQDQVAIEMPSQRSLGKRRRSVAAEQESEEASESDDEASLPLPSISHEESNTQMRTSGRVRKRSKRQDDGFDYY